MSDGRSRERWEHTAFLAAMLANVNRDPKKTKPFKPDDFNPFADQVVTDDVIEIDGTNIGVMRKAFTGK